MPEDILIFNRIEKKYILTRETADKLRFSANNRLLPDRYGKSTVLSLYLDTPDYRIIRTSQEAENYKEKLRVRSYGTPRPDGKVFFEIKKKFNGVVYKRRISLRLDEVETYIRGGDRPCTGQIINEIDYAMNFYSHPQPSVLISCEREAFYDTDMTDVRLTFDTGIRYRSENLSPVYGSSGFGLLPADTEILEVKSLGGMPLWLSKALDRYGVFPTKFSKYGAAYRDIVKNKAKILREHGYV